MSKEILLIGVGEMGGVFARAFLKAGYTIVPVTRETDWAGLTGRDFAAVLVAVGEKDLQATLEKLPQNWQDRVILLQNELLPKDWQKHELTNPTVISVWFEKKYPNDYKVIIPSPVYGPQAALIAEALKSLNIPVKICADENELLFELILKNLYILTTNVCGLKVGGTVGELWHDHEALARAVAGDVLNIQFHLAGKELDREQLIQAMVAAFEGDRDHKCMGRSAPARLERALTQAQEAGLDTPALNEIQNIRSA